MLFEETFRFPLRPVLITLLVLNMMAGYSQPRHTFYYGKVMDAGTKRPLRGVNLLVQGTTLGTTTDRSGDFSFFIDSVPAILAISHVGYQTKYVYLDHTSFSLTLYLDKQVSELKEVEIISRAHEPFYKDPHYAVLDYLPDSGMIYLLVFRYRLSDCEIICKGYTGDTIARSGKLTFSASSFSKDCLGTMHLLGHDSGFQLFRQGNIIRLIHPVKLRKYENVLKNCVAASPDVLYFKKPSSDGQMVEYYGINRKTLQRLNLSKVMDEEKQRMLRRNEEDRLYAGSRGQIPGSRDAFVNWNYVNKILYRPIKTTLYRIGGFTCIFNNPAKTIEFYDDDGNFSYKLALQTDSVFSGRWLGDILTDPVTHYVYTLFISNGSVSLYMIDLNSGRLIKKTSLYHLYPEKIKVYGRHVYYLYDVAGDADNKMLFRQYIL